MFVSDMIEKLQKVAKEYGGLVPVEVFDDNGELQPVEAIWYIESDAVDENNNIVSVEGPTVILADDYLFAPTHPVRIK